jgi:predicted transcriptional regulator
MLAAKQEALQIIAEMPDDADMNEIMYRLYVLDKVRKGQDAAAKGEIVTSEELEREIESW